MTITVNGLTELQQQFEREAPLRMRVLSQQVLNRTTNRGRTRLVRIVTGELNLQAGYVREQITVRTATRDRLEAALVARKRPILLSRFDPREITKASGPRVKGQKRKRAKAGISIRIKRGGPREVLPGAFLFESPKNKALILALRAPSMGKKGARSGKDVIKVRPGRTPRKARLAVDALYGPSVDQLYKRNRPELQVELLAELRTELDRRIASETLGKAKRRLVR